MKDWSEEILIGPNGSYRALMQGQKEIADVDCLDRNFVRKIIEAHNSAITETMKESMEEGINIAKEVYAKKK